MASHPSTKPSAGMQAHVIQMAVTPTGTKVTWGWSRSRGKILEEEEEKGLREKGTTEATDIFCYLIYKDFGHMISILTAILRKEGQTVIGLQTLEVKLKEIKPHTRWCRQLAIQWDPQNSRKIWKPLFRPPA